MPDGSLKWAPIVGCPYPLCPCTTECPLSRPIPEPDHVNEGAPE